MEEGGGSSDCLYHNKINSYKSHLSNEIDNLDTWK